MWDAAASIAIQPLLNPGESLIWCGRPSVGLRLSPSDALAIPFSLLWVAAGVLWFSIGAALPLSLPKIILRLAFIGIAFFLLVGRYLLDALFRRMTFYGLTSRRIIIVVILAGVFTRALDLSTHPSIELEPHKNGAGTIGIARTVVSLVWALPPGALRCDLNIPLSLEGISNAAEVYAAIRSIEESLPGESGRPTTR